MERDWVRISNRTVTVDIMPHIFGAFAAQCGYFWQIYFISTHGFVLKALFGNNLDQLAWTTCELKSFLFPSS